MTEESEKKIQETYARILKLCKTALEKDLNFQLVMYGSVINGLSLAGKNTSDLDLILVIKSILCEDLADQIFKDKFILDTIQNQIFINIQAFSEVELITTSFGYLLQFKDVKSGYKIDISVNKVTDPYNSYLI